MKTRVFEVHVLINQVSVVNQKISASSEDGLNWTAEEDFEVASPHSPHFQKFPLLRIIDRDDRTVMIDAVLKDDRGRDIKHLAAGEQVVFQGERGDDLFALEYVH